MTDDILAKKIAVLQLIREEQSEEIDTLREQLDRKEMVVKQLRSQIEDDHFAIEGLRKRVEELIRERDHPHIH